ncbi:MAG: alcohol dehydrogenase [Fibrobacteres bacterium]|nr:alcohol dehydrogenase [Fibrobacterota bacterium]
MLACGVCRTDLHIVEGDLPPAKASLIPGHQVVGEVDALGQGAEGFRIGETAGVTWLHSTDGRCGYCRDGLENLCENARFTGLHADGGYAESMIVRAAFAFRLPERLPPMEAAPLLCAGVIGYRSLKVSGIKPGQALGLFGFGASAHLALQVALGWDCRVYAFTREESHRRQALAMGAAWAGGIDEEPPEPLHAAVTFAPSGRVAVAALSRLRRGGTVAINAVHMDPLPMVPYPLLYHERGLRSVANLTRRDVIEFLDLAARGTIRAQVNPFPLAGANGALAALKASAFPGAAVLRVQG